MKLEKPTFDKLLIGLKEVPDAVYANGAKLFAGKKGTAYEPFVEQSLGGRMTASYLIYATINGKTLPIEPSIIPSMLDFSGCEAEPCMMMKVGGVPKECACNVAHNAIDAVIDKPLEILAVETERKGGCRPKWHIVLLRDGDGAGFLHDSVARQLAKD